MVERDPKEQGERALLNFGHTIGHAIEKLSDFSLYHGECVGLGIVAASYLSMQLGHISKEDFERIKKVVWGEYIRSQNDVEDYAVTFLQMLFMDIDYFNFYDVYKTITFEDVQKHFEEHFVKEHSALSVINPV